MLQTLIWFSNIENKRKIQKLLLLINLSSHADPMIYVFPRMTKCTFHKFGTSGNIEKHDALCILPLNIVNEKIYIFIWFWLLLLGVLSFLVLVYRIVIIFSPYIRAFVLRLRYRRVKRECIGKFSKWFYVWNHLYNHIAASFLLNKTMCKLCFTPT